jgi:hypothetical protein
MHGVLIVRENRGFSRVPAREAKSRKLGLHARAVPDRAFLTISGPRRQPAED